MRRFALRLAAFGATASSSSSAPPVTPYQVVLRAVEQEGRGLLAAAEVFKQFQRYYHTYQQEEAQVGSGKNSNAALPSSPLGTQRLRGKPLTQFCGRAEDVEPLTMLLLKVLCDLQRLEEMRFLFTQCLLEMDQQTPSVELFNVYLLAISMTDTFNQYEVENLVELQRAKLIAPDIVTKLSMFLLYLRLGHHNCVAWWPTMRDEVTAILDSSDVARYPLLPLRLQHCFQTLLRLHYDTAVIHECLQLLRRASPDRVTPSLMLPYLLLSALNNATPPSAVVDVLQMIEGPLAAHTDDANADSSATPSAAAAAGTTPSSSSPSNDGPLLSSEITMFRLLAKCAKYGDADAAAYLRGYLARYPDVAIITAENRPMASLLYVEALTRSGQVRAALRVLETEVPAPLCRPGERPKLFLQSCRLSLLSTDPVTNVVAALAPLVAALHVEDPVRTLVEEKPGAAEENERLPVPVTHITLDLFLAACEHAGGATRAEEVLRLYPRYDTAPTGATYTRLLTLYAATSPADGVARLPSLQQEMKDAGVGIDAAWLHAAMALALNAQDMGAALDVADLHLSHKASIEVKHGILLLRQLATVADVEGMRRAVRVLRASKSPIDPRSLALCAGVLKSLGISADVLHAR